ncbi:MAG: hypothetical protein WAW60_01400 [Candidatus Saccharimonadales bacterium]
MSTTPSPESTPSNHDIDVEIARIMGQNAATAAIHKQIRDGEIHGTLDQIDPTESAKAPHSKSVEELVNDLDKDLDPDTSADEDSDKMWAEFER